MAGQSPIPLKPRKQFHTQVELRLLVQLPSKEILVVFSFPLSRFAGISIVLSIYSGKNLMFPADYAVNAKKFDLVEVLREKVVRFLLIFTFMATVFGPPAFCQETSAGGPGVKIECSSDKHRAFVSLRPHIQDKNWVPASSLPDGENVKYYNGSTYKKIGDSGDLKYCEFDHDLYISVVWTKEHGGLVDFVVNGVQFGGRSYAFGDLVDATFYVFNSDVKIKLCEITNEKPGYYSEKDGFRGVVNPVFVDSYCGIDTASSLIEFRNMNEDAAYLYNRYAEWDHGPSFDCDLAVSYVDKVICDDIDLIRMDRYMAGQYWRIVNWGLDVAPMVEVQKKWLAKRANECGLPTRVGKTNLAKNVLENGKICLKEVYAKRMWVLGEQVRLIDLREKRIFQ